MPKGKGYNSVKKMANSVRKTSKRAMTPTAKLTKRIIIPVGTSLRQAMSRVKKAIK